MSALLKKLNHKNTQPIVLLNLPAELLFLNEEFNTVSTVSSILTQKVHFLLAFCTMQEEVNTLATQCLPLTEGDATIWFAYPKTASKRYTCNFNRDTG